MNVVSAKQSLVLPQTTFQDDSKKISIAVPPATSSSPTILVTASVSSAKTEANRRKRLKKKDRGQITKAREDLSGTATFCLKTYTQSHSSQTLTTTPIEPPSFIRIYSCTPDEAVEVKIMFSSWHLSSALDCFYLWSLHVSTLLGENEKLQAIRDQFHDICVTFCSTHFLEKSQLAEPEKWAKASASNYFLTEEEFYQRLLQLEKNIQSIIQENKAGFRSVVEKKFKPIIVLMNLMTRLISQGRLKELMVSISIFKESASLSPGTLADYTQDLVKYWDFHRIFFNKELDPRFEEGDKFLKQSLQKLSKLHAATTPQFSEIKKHLLTLYLFFQTNNQTLDSRLENIVIGIHKVDNNAFTPEEEALNQTYVKGDVYSFLLRGCGILLSAKVTLQELASTIAEHILPEYYPFLLNEHKSLLRFQNILFYFLEVGKNVPVTSLTCKKEWGQKEQPLLNFLRKTQSDLQNLFNKYYTDFPLADIHSYDLVQLFSGSFSIKIFKPFLSLFTPLLEKLPELLQELAQLQHEHAKELQAALSELSLTDQKKEELSALLKTNRYEQAKPICRLIFLLKEAEILLNFETLSTGSDALTDGWKYVVPQKLIDYLVMRVQWPKTAVAAPDSPGKTALVVIEADSKQENKEDDEKELIGTTTTRRARGQRQKEKPIFVPYPGINRKKEIEEETESSFKIGDSADSYEVLKELLERDFFLDRITGDHAIVKDKKTKKIVPVPLSQRNGLKPGTKHAIEKQVNTILDKRSSD